MWGVRVACIVACMQRQTAERWGHHNGRAGAHDSNNSDSDSSGEQAQHKNRGDHAIERQMEAELHTFTPQHLSEPLTIP